jgi:hypothetical protein
LGEIGSWDYFFTRRSTIWVSILETMEFPGNKFYFKKLEKEAESPSPKGGRAI